MISHICFMTVLLTACLAVPPDRPSDHSPTVPLTVIPNVPVICIVVLLVLCLYLFHEMRRIRGLLNFYGGRKPTRFDSTASNKNVHQISYWLWKGFWFQLKPSLALLVLILARGVCEYMETLFSTTLLVEATDDASIIDCLFKWVLYTNIGAVL